MLEKSNLVLLLFLLMMCCSSFSSTLPQQAAPAAPSASCFDQKCGDLMVPYPFALVQLPACPAFSPFFRLHCDASSSKLFINIGNYTVEVILITSDSLIIDGNRFKATFSVLIESSCIGGGTASVFLPPYPSPFVISDDNLLGAFGCVMAVRIMGNVMPLESYPAPTPNPYDNSGADADGTDLLSNAYPGDFHVGGCWCSCTGIELHNPKCGFRTCCTSPLDPKSAPRLAIITVGIPLPLSTGPCDVNNTYSILFHPNYTDFENESYRLKLNWALPFNESNENVIIESSNYACSSNAAITIVGGIPGYLCYCPVGFTGDGYLEGSGCTDVNECMSANECVSKSICHNEEGNYTCSCKYWFYSGDGRINGLGCHFSLTVKIAVIFASVGVSAFFMISLCVCFAVWWKWRTKRKYFVQNGGWQIQTCLKGMLGREAIQLYAEKELEIATNNYAEGMKLGSGGSGMVFKGVLHDGKLVAIKRAKSMGSIEGGDSELFMNEIAILTQINHRHIVRLLGCCLETKVPLLVYEYVPNGNVAESLAAEKGNGVVMCWEQRLKVALQVGEALAYLHAAASPPILHRDVKSANVLLDDNLDAKIADFGLSRLIPENAEQVATAIQGTIGYLDPEYFFTLQLTDRSDVYSFGVMLAELITGLKAVDSRNRDARFANLALLFIETYQKGSLDELIDPRLGFTSVDAQAHIYPSIMAVASLARHCLALESSARPSMNEVAHELRRLSDSFQTFAYGYDDEACRLPRSQRKAINFDFEHCAAYVAKGSQSNGYHSGSLQRKLVNTTTLPR